MKTFKAIMVSLIAVVGIFLCCGECETAGMTWLVKGAGLALVLIACIIGYRHRDEFDDIDL